MSMYVVAVLSCGAGQHGTYCCGHRPPSREAGGVSVAVALVRADTSAAEPTRRIGGLSAAGREPAAGDTVPSTVTDVVFSDLFTDEEVGLGFLAINLSRPQYLKATVGL